ncbi:hypothetical protein NP233_g3563 [Leucocoprinus birnbaumii]|uniref:C2H2-type domain-containing protein n=1 Tax=Leucocoprinus birnbaumii TaxID=56174 RepID=A0AAD5YSQ1_9AGAR|nr:hypothetical protein NP233_g3563 [Leucocoprinus birnbaumii]
MHHTSTTLAQFKKERENSRRPMADRYCKTCDHEFKRVAEYRRHMFGTILHAGPRARAYRLATTPQPPPPPQAPQTGHFPLVVNGDAIHSFTTQPVSNQPDGPSSSATMDIDYGYDTIPQYPATLGMGSLNSQLAETPSDFPMAGPQTDSFFGAGPGPSTFNTFNFLSGEQHTYDVEAPAQAAPVPTSGSGSMPGQQVEVQDLSENDSS